jgi:flavin-dependent thymidylate synthase
VSKEIVRIADVAMYDSKPYEGLHVKLLSMTQNPLRVIATAAEMYSGKVITDPSEISRKKALEWLEDLQRTGTGAPLEFVEFHFLFEGVTRAFTHQLVRQRIGATYVQESMRFAVKRDAALAVVTPPSIAALKEDDPRRVLWDAEVKRIGETYNALIDNNIPAEDARGLLPTNIATRIHYHTSLRGLRDHAGMRLCSQAQYEWKQVWGLMLRAIRNAPYELDGHSFNEAWQYDAISKVFKPVCYHTGKCEFMAATDRFCSIRERVQAHYAKGEPSSTWGRDIDPLEPLLEGAARKAPAQDAS